MCQFPPPIVAASLVDLRAGNFEMRWRVDALNTEHGCVGCILAVVIQPRRGDRRRYLPAMQTIGAGLI